MFHYLKKCCDCGGHKGSFTVFLLYTLLYLEADMAASHKSNILLSVYIKFSIETRKTGESLGKIHRMNSFAHNCKGHRF